MIKVVQGETQIVQHEMHENLSDNDSCSNGDGQELQDVQDVNMADNDVSVSTGNRNGNRDSDYVPNSAEESPSDHIIPKRKKKRKKKEIVESTVIIQHYKLHQFQFNGGSDLNRMDKSRWDQNSSCASTKSAQSDNLYFIQWTLLAQCKDNKAVSMLGESEKLETLRLETLFDDHRGPSYFWIPCALLPANYDGANEYLLTVAIVHNNNVKGIINGFIDEWNADDSLDASHPGVRMCELIKDAWRLKILQLIVMIVMVILKNCVFLVTIM